MMRFGRKTAKKLLQGGIGAILLFPGGYLLLAVLLSLLVANPGFEEAEAGVTVYVTTNGLHAYFMLPTRNAVMDWTKHADPADFPGASAAPAYFEIGWGERQFYLETPTWSDMRVGTTLQALLWPTRSALHVTYWPRAPRPDERTYPIRLSRRQYERLADWISGYFVLNAKGEGVLIPVPGYFDRDRFYESHGRYSALWTCNNWVGAGLKKAGVRTSVWSPFDRGLLFQLKRLE